MNDMTIDVPITEASVEGEERCIPHHRLVLSKHQARKNRKASPGDDAKLRESIIRRGGLIHNIVVVIEELDDQGPIFGVVAGGRRWEQYGQLIELGRLPADVTLRATIVSEDDARAISRDENATVLPMHPADEYECYAEEVRAGATLKEVATMMGVGVDRVRKVMAIANLHPEIFEKFREDEIDMVAACAYARTESQERQLEVYRSLGPRAGSDWSIRSALNETRIATSDPRAKFVRTEYKRRGGAIDEDLFGEAGYYAGDVEESEAVRYLLDVGLVNELVDEKLARAVAKYEKGWLWAESLTGTDRHTRYHETSQIAADEDNTPEEVSEELERLGKLVAGADDAEDPEQLEAARKRIGEIGRDRREKYAGWSANARAQSGVIVMIGHDGVLDVRCGRQRAGDVKTAKAAAEARGESFEALGPDAAGSMEMRGTGRRGPSAAERDLGLERREVYANAVAGDADLARDLLEFEFLRQVLSAYWKRKLLGMTLVARPMKHSKIKLDEMPATKALLDRRGALDTAWFGIKSDEGSFAAFTALDKRKRKALIAWAVGHQLHAGDISGGKGEDLPSAAKERLDVAVADWWRPHAAFLRRLKASELLEIGAKVIGGRFRVDHVKKPKNVLVECLTEVFETNGEGHGDKVAGRVKAYLPKGMR